jgi:hypothetical protein
VRWLLIALFLISTSRAFAQDRAQTSGLAVGAGVGFENAGVGGQVQYYVQTANERWRIAPHIGVGYFGRAAVSGGVMALFGRRHRLVIDLMASPAAADGGTGRATKVHYALSLLAGWEWMSFRGIAIRSTFGVGIGVEGDEAFVAANPLSVVFKFW